LTPKRLFRMDNLKGTLFDWIEKKEGELGSELRRAIKGRREKTR